MPVLVDEVPWDVGIAVLEGLLGAVDELAAPRVAPASVSRNVFDADDAGDELEVGADVETDAVGLASTVTAEPETLHVAFIFGVTVCDCEVVGVKDLEGTGDGVEGAELATEMGAVLCAAVGVVPMV